MDPTHIPTAGECAYSLGGEGGLRRGGMKEGGGIDGATNSGFAGTVGGGISFVSSEPSFLSLDSISLTFSLAVSVKHSSLFSVSVTSVWVACGPGLVSVVSCWSSSGPSVNRRGPAPGSWFQYGPLSVLLRPLAPCTWKTPNIFQIASSSTYIPVTSHTYQHKFTHTEANCTEYLS